MIVITEEYLWDFIVENDLTHLIYESLLHIEETFGKDIKVSLDIDTFNIEYLKLWLTISSPFEVEETRLKLNNLDKWWIKNAYRAKNKLSINTKYV